MGEHSYRYAGLQNVYSPGLSVAAASERLRRFAYSEQRLMRLLASRIVTLPERDIKALLARFQHEDALHTDAWRARLSEMRVNKNKIDHVPDPALEILFDEAEHLPRTYPFLKVVTHLFKQALCDAYRTYLVATNELADFLSVRLARLHLQDEEEHVRLLTQALEDLQPTEEDLRLASEWETALSAYLAAAGGIDGTAERTEARERSASVQPYRIPHEITRDNTLSRVWDFEAPPVENTRGYLNYMMGLRLSEINVAEGLAIVLFETPSMPWSFYLDIARHCWDEMRHSLFGEAAIESTYGERNALPMRDYEGVYVMEAPPLEQYAVLGLEVEGKNMKYPPGKRQEWEFSRDEAKHPLMTTLQDFDWADEVLHVNIARRQLDHWFEGGLKAIVSFSANGREHRVAVKKRHTPSPIPDPQPQS